MKNTFAILLVVATAALAAGPEMPRFRWESFTTANGLPDDHVFNVLVDGQRVWAATENGLGLYENGKWKVYRPADGLAHRAVLWVAADKRTGDIWAATMGGLSRFSAGRFFNYTQLSSGLANDVVYGVAVDGDSVWVATAAGGSRLNTRTGQWSQHGLAPGPARRERRQRFLRIRFRVVLRFEPESRHRRSDPRRQQQHHCHRSYM